MNDVASPLKTRGVPHEPATPSLQMVDVSVVYTAGANGKAAVQRAAVQKTAVNDKNHALKNITFRVETGQHIAVVGPNGAGKSTLFKLIVGTLKPSRGLVQVYGHGPSGHICIAYVPQRNDIDWSFPVTVEDVVMMGRVGQIGLFRRPRRHDWEMVRASLARVNAMHLAPKQIGELSGGQQQRVFVARALAQEAERFDQIMLLNREIVAFGDSTAVLSPQNLLQAYGGHLHVVGRDEEAVLLAETGGDHKE
jgi:manganese/iron transport system ATP-binding protein